MDSPCLASLSLHPLRHHTHQSRQHWGFPEDREKAPHLERDKASPFLVSCGGKKLQTGGSGSPGRWLGPTASCPPVKSCEEAAPGSGSPRDPGGQAPQLLPGSTPQGKEAAWPGPQPHSHMFWMILKAADELPHGLALIAHPVHGHEQREPRMGKERPSLVS